MIVFVKPRDMKLRHAAALALLIALRIGCSRGLISWTLIFPPLTEDDSASPLRAAGRCLPQARIIIWQVGRLIQLGDILIVIGAVLNAFAVAGFVLAYTYYRGEIPKDTARVIMLSYVAGFGLLYSVLLYRSVPHERLVLGSTPLRYSLRFSGIAPIPFSRS
jgi:hypothetical protein